MKVYEFNIFGWLVGESDSMGKHTTRIPPSNLNTTDIPGKPRCNWTGTHWEVLPYVHQDEEAYLQALKEARSTQPMVSVRKEIESLKARVSALENNSKPGGGLNA